MAALRHPGKGGVFILVLAASSQLRAASPAQVLTRRQHHLRSGTQPEWDEFKNKKPEGSKLELRFAARRNSTAQTLIIEQSDVKQEWPVRLNGTNLGKLFLMEASLVHVLPIPPGILREGENILTVVPPKENDDVLIGPIHLDSRPPDQLFSEGGVQIHVRENGGPVPCRITITRRDDTLAALYSSNGEQLAIRPGVVYTATGEAELSLLPGKYSIFASRGPEYSIAAKDVKVRPGQRAQVSLSIKREVPTAGWASGDTHVHTWTYSKHGDATLDERMLTIAGEGLELPVATDHNLVIDYSAAAGSNRVEQFFTPVIGDEVTTAKGHFNAFPILTGSKPPDFKIEPWPALMEAIRATPEVQIVVLNHPTDTHNNFCPFALTNFNRVTGENLRGFDFSFDAVELVNSGTLRSDLMETFRAWFALLNYGYHVTGIGGSDSHDVSRFIVGQGRTYIQCDDRDAGQINVGEVCRSLRAGHASISLGLMINMQVDAKFGMGDLASNSGPQISVMIEVLGPSWTRADHLELFANGNQLREARIRPTSKVQKAQVRWTFPRPSHDVYLVAVATGPGVTSPHWAIPRPYQPNSTKWNPRVLAATNPIWLDADGDGQFTSAREYARRIVERVGTDPAALIPVLAAFDEAVAAQSASLCQAHGQDVRAPAFRDALRRATAPVQAGFSAYETTLPSPL